MADQELRAKQIAEIIATVVEVKSFPDREDKRLIELHIKVKVHGRYEAEAVRKAIDAAREAGAHLGIDKDGDDIVLPLKRSSRGWRLDVVAVRIPKSNSFAQVRNNSLVRMKAEFEPFCKTKSHSKGVVATLKNMEVLK